MGRPARFSTELLVGTATALAAEGGPAAVTMAAVARGAGAPSGSLYHRFPGRPALLAAVWLHALEDFQAGCREALSAEPALEAAVGTARHVVAWSRARPDLARVLLYRPTEFDSPHWPEADRSRMSAANAGVGGLLARVALALREPGEEEARARERVRLAVVDLPLSLVRRHLLGGGGVPEDAEALAAESARRLLQPPSAPGGAEPPSGCAGDGPGASSDPPSGLRK
ncbi:MULTISPECIES: TetR/AcrR family transcriptional regulator [unclassified Nocardiopsis]|uniref:TetR/AcrR family transcriptional regulator n=1 Tax=unclassified Nocardiopsis TaxID=2649073 RepID=UPI00135936A7|nr:MULTISPECIES: TetR/AcrR family transcriptional regulator [unclassified Nocardiopsis]